MRREILTVALRAQRSATLDGLRRSGWPPQGPSPPGVAERVARLLAVDQGVVTGRLVITLRKHPTREAYEAALTAAAEPWRRRPADELAPALARWGERSTRLARRVPSAVTRVRVRGWFGRQPFRYLLVRRVLEEWAAFSEHSPAERVRPEVGHCLSVGVLAALPAATLPVVDLDSGVVRLVVDVVGGEELAVSGRRVRRPPARLTWSFDFSRRQYGPRVTEPPDAVVRLTAERLAALAELGGDWRQNPEIVLEGDERPAAALLDGIASLDREAGIRGGAGDA